MLYKHVWSLHYPYYPTPFYQLHGVFIGTIYSQSENKMKNMNHAHNLFLFNINT